MHRIYQTFIDCLTESTDAADLQKGMEETTRALDLSCFAYLRVSGEKGGVPQLISTYPPAWTALYLKNRYERFDPVITQALQDTEPFQWGVDLSTGVRSDPQREMLEDAAGFGIACGFTIPIHDGRGPPAAVTFATDTRRGTAFTLSIDAHKQALQLMAMYLHAHVRHKLTPIGPSVAYRYRLAS